MANPIKVPRTTHQWLKPLYDWLDALGLLGQSATVHTTDATATTLLTVAVPTGKIVSIEADVTGLKSDNTQGAAYIMRCAYRNQAGTLHQIADDEVDLDIEDDATWGAPESAISTTNVLIKIVGKAATSIYWTGSVRVHMS